MLEKNIKISLIFQDKMSLIEATSYLDEQGITGFQKLAENKLILPIQDISITSKICAKKNIPFTYNKKKIVLYKQFLAKFSHLENDEAELVDSGTGFSLIKKGFNNSKYTAYRASYE